MVKLEKFKEVNNFFDKKTTDDEELRFKLKLRVWDKINTMSKRKENSLTESTNDLIYSTDNIQSFLDRVEKTEKWELNTIIDNGICAKCGTCSIVCPNNAIYFNNYPYITVDCPRKGMGTCMDVCPRIKSGSNPLLNALNIKNEYFHTTMFDGHTNSLLNHILKSLIDDDKIDGAIFVGNYQWKPVSMMVTDKYGIDDSIYGQYTISTLDAITEAANRGLERIAVIALPCQVAGLRNIQYHDLLNGHEMEVNAEGKKAIIPKIEYIIGVFCNAKYEHSDMLDVLHKKNITMDVVNRFELKEEALAVYLDDKVEFIPYDEINPSSGCMMCRDYDAELADISIGSIDDDKNITSLIVRTDKGRLIKKYLKIENGIDINKLNSLIDKKQTRFENEVKRREKENEFNSYYYIWRHPGFIEGKDGLVNVILPTPIAGFYDPDSVIKIAQISKEYNCDLKVTNRENFHLENVSPKFLEEILAKLNKIDEFKNSVPSETLSVCPGDKSCFYGQIDTEELAKKCYDILNSHNLDNKFKISVGGCPYPCLKYSLTDFGVYSKKLAKTNMDNCLGCDRCAQKCKQKAITVINDIAEINYDKCIGCGKCFKNCPNDAKDIKFEGYQLFVGGKAVKGIVEGCPIEVETEEEVLKILENTILLTKKYSKSKYERVGTIMNRMGKTNFLEELMSFNN